MILILTLVYILPTEWTQDKCWLAYKIITKAEIPSQKSNRHWVYTLQ
jgi:predicted nucleic acid-binding protein